MSRTDASNIVTAAPSRRGLLTGAVAGLAVALPAFAAAEPVALTENDRLAIRLWRERRSALAHCDEAYQREDAADAAVAERMRRDDLDRGDYLKGVPEMYHEIVERGMRVASEHRAKYAIGLDQIVAESQAASAARNDIEHQIVGLNCDGATATAAVCFIYLQDQMHGGSLYDNPNLSFFRTVLSGLLPSLRGEIAESVAQVLALNCDDDPESSPIIA